VVEQWPEEPRVVSPILTFGTTKNKNIFSTFIYIIAADISKQIRPRVHFILFRFD
jgi:hypothetical protein